MQQLPGGIIRDGGLRRDFSFHPLSGHLELAIAENLNRPGSRPRQVSALLGASLRQIADLEVKPETVDLLCSGDRQFLLLSLCWHLGIDQQWRTAECAECGEKFDFNLTFADLPVKPAGKSFPWIELETGQGHSLTAMESEAKAVSPR